MDEVRLEIGSTDGEVDPALVDALRMDLAEHVGATAFHAAPSRPGEKSAMSMDVATLVVALLGAPAVTALIGVLKSYLERNRTTEMVVTTPRGSFTLRQPGRSALTESEIRRALDAVLGPD